MKLSELEQYFSSLELPVSLQLDDSTRIFDLKKCISSNIAYLKANSGNMAYKPYYDQLIKIKEKLEKQE